MLWTQKFGPNFRPGPARPDQWVNFFGRGPAQPMITSNLGIPRANQIQPGQVGILLVNAPGRDWLGFYQLGRSHLNHGIAGCRIIGLNIPSTSEFIIGNDRLWTIFNRVGASRIWVSCMLGKVKCTRVESLIILVRSL